MVQQYEQFIIFEDESIDSAFSRFNTIITSLKALNEGYYSKNYVRKFLRVRHPKWRVKVTTIEDSKDWTSLSLDELIRNIKVHDLIIKKDFEIVKGKGERRSLALKAKKESSDEESLTFGSKDEEYALAVRDFKKFFKKEVGSEYPKPPRDKNQRAFVRGFWSDGSEEDDEKILGIPTEGQCSFTDNWYLDSLALSTPSRGPYCIVPPSPDLIKAYIQLNHRIMSNFLKFSSDQYVLYYLVMYPLTQQQVRKTRMDYSTKRSRHFTSASSSSAAFDHPSLSHHVDDDNNEIDEGTSRVSTPSPSSYVNSLSDDVP
nr:hypothetical protein [Tanacetum cinerariifolium]